MDPGLRAGRLQPRVEPRRPDHDRVHSDDPPGRPLERPDGVHGRPPGAGEGPRFDRARAFEPGRQLDLIESAGTDRGQEALQGFCGRARPRGVEQGPARRLEPQTARRGPQDRLRIIDPEPVGRIARPGDRGREVAPDVGRTVVRGLGDHRRHHHRPEVRTISRLVDPRPGRIGSPHSFEGKVAPRPGPATATKTSWGSCGARPSGTARRPGPARATWGAGR